MALPTAARIAIGACMATALATRGRRKKSLSRSGAAAAWVVGFLSFASGVRFGMTLLMFYLSATRATRYGADIKRRLEDGFTAETGNRSARQVLASSLPGVILCVWYAIFFEPRSLISRGIGGDTAAQTGSALALGFELFFAACAGDTMSSELGIVAPERFRSPVLVLAPWRSVPPGTNGGVTPFGTLGSLFGGLIVGLTFFFTGPSIEASQAGVIFVGVLGGFIGSLLDSVLGMLLQASWYDRATGKVLKEAPSDVQRKNMQHLCGFDILSGEAVNVLSAIMTAALAPVMLSTLFR